MPYAVTSLDPVPEEPEIELEGGEEGSETDVESGKASDETLSFLRWKLKGDVQNSNPARDFYKKGAARYCFAAASNLLPWIINFILAIVVVALAVRLESKGAVSKNEIPTDVIYSEFVYYQRGRFSVLVLLSDCDYLAALADEAVEYRIETTYASKDYPDSEYQGWPNAHKDKLWSKYEGSSHTSQLSHTHIVLTSHTPLHRG